MGLLRDLPFIFILGFCSLVVVAQTPFQLDPTFQVDMNGQSHNYSHGVGDFFIEDDGSIIMVGGFEHISWPLQYPRFVVKLHRDGQRDTQFNYGHPSGTNGTTRITRHNGMYYLGHQRYPGVSRIFPDGTVDTSFRFPMDSFFGGQVQVSDIHVLADGKVLVCGVFDTCSAGGYGILRLHQDGSIDTTFYSPFVDKYLDYIFLLPDGKYLIGGAKYDMQQTRKCVWRIYPDGHLDSSFYFQCDWGAVGFIDTLDTSGKLICCGLLEVPGHSSRLGLVRLNDDGSIDSAFCFNNYFDIYPRSFIQQNDRLLVGGGFKHINGRKYNSLAVFDTLGRLDTLMSANLPGTDTLYPYFQKPGFIWLKGNTNEILASGGFASIDGFSSYCMVRLHGLTAGMREREEKDRMRCFPNPVSGQVNITLDKPLYGSYHIHDLSGRLLRSGALHPVQKNHQINLLQMAPGVYLLQVTSKDGRAFCEKLVVTDQVK